jgi:hypothetical protein
MWLVLTTTKKFAFVIAARERVKGNKNQKTFPSKSQLNLHNFFPSIEIDKLKNAENSFGSRAKFYVFDGRK